MENKDLKQIRGGQTLSDEQMKDVSGGGMGQIIDSFYGVYQGPPAYCKYCGKKFTLPSKCIKHEQTCEQKPKN